MRFDRSIEIIELVLLCGESPELSHRADFEYYQLFREHLFLLSQSLAAWFPKSKNFHSNCQRQQLCYHSIWSAVESHAPDLASKIEWLSVLD